MQHEFYGNCVSAYSVNCVIMELCFLDENNGALLGSTEYDLIDISIYVSKSSTEKFDLLAQLFMTIKDVSITN